MKSTIARTGAGEDRGGDSPGEDRDGDSPGKIVMEILQKFVTGIPQDDEDSPGGDGDGDSPGEDCDGDSPDDGIPQENTVMGIPLMEIPQKTVMGFTHIRL